MTEAVVVLDREADIDSKIRELRSLIENHQVDEARRFVEELSARWPGSEHVAKWRRVLAPPEVLGTSPGANKSREAERGWLAAHAKEHPGCWMALEGDRLIAVDSDLAVVRAALKAAGLTAVLLHFQPDPAKWRP